MTSADLQLLCDQAVRRHQTGDLAGAEALYLQILQDEPSHFAARHLLGVVRYQEGHHAEAVSLIEAALAANPDHAEALSNYGAVLIALGRLPEALAAYDKALAIHPDFAAAWNGRGAALADLNRFEEALDNYDRALAITPDFALALSNRARVRQYLGRLEEGRADYQRALALAPGMANVWLDYADSLEVPAGLLEQMEAARKDAHSDTDRLHLDFALAKGYADVKDHRRSFQHLLSGNARKRALVSYDEAAILSFFDNIRARFTADALRQKQALGGGAPTQAPVFIIGMMRSGSTLVEQILASHPAVHAAGELPAFGDAVNATRGPDGETYPDFVAKLDAAAITRIAEAYLAQIPGLAAGQLRVTDKMPTNFFFAGLIHLALPNARIIHTVRDPVDTCVSCFSKLFTTEQYHTYDLAELGRYYRRYQQLMAHWGAILPPGRILDVRYEDVVADLEGQARRIIAHCGLEWDPRCLSFHTTKRPVRTASMLQVRQQLYQSGIGRAHVYEEFLAPLRDALAGP